VFDNGVMVARPVNADDPGKGPLRPMGSIPVLVRLVDADGTERWIPARANRWTRTHVLVTWLEDPAAMGRESGCWLARDVARELRGTTATVAPRWQRLRPPR